LLRLAICPKEEFFDIRVLSLSNQFPDRYLEALKKWDGVW
jgi:hypothetical protein